MRLLEVIDGLFVQLMESLAGRGEIDYEHLFVDGTKLEARANRYSFVWRKSVEKRLLKLKEKAAKLLSVPEGEVSLEMVKAALSKQEQLCRTQDVVFVSGKGNRKPPEQKRWEELRNLAEKWEEYFTHLEIMGPGRNSYSKTDPLAGRG